MLAKLAGDVVDDIDFRRREIHVLRQVLGRGLIRPPKGRTGKPSKARVVPVEPILYKALTDHVSYLGRSSGSFFCPLGRTERYCYGSWVNEQLEGIQVCAGLVDVNGGQKYDPHSLRHVAGSVWPHRGCDLQEVSWWLGHQDVTTTSRVYAKQLKGRLSHSRRQIERTPELFPEVPALPRPECNENATE